MTLSPPLQSFLDPSSSPLFNIVLHEPEIPNNTGNIGRTCVATHSALHLIHPLGFELSEKACRRAGLDYWPRLDLHEHATFDDFLNNTQVSPNRLWLLTTRTDRCVFDVSFQRGDYLVFGRESRGLPLDLIDRYSNRCIGLPMVPGERSLNLASVVASTVYVGMYQLLARNELGIGPENH